MASAFALPIRIAQGFLALLILILMAYVVNNWANGWWSPDSANFLLFCAVWTLLAVAYLVLSSIRFHDHPIGHKFGVLAVEIVTTIFWFAGWVAFACLLGDLPASQWWTVKRVGEAAVVFAAIEWLLFIATMIMSSLHCWRTRRDHTSKQDPNMVVDNRV
jgi:uncharacterized membrane protein